MVVRYRRPWGRQWHVALPLPSKRAAAFGGDRKPLVYGLATPERVDTLATFLRGMSPRPPYIENTAKRILWWFDRGFRGEP